MALSIFIPRNISELYSVLVSLSKINRFQSIFVSVSFTIPSTTWRVFFQQFINTMQKTSARQNRTENSTSDECNSLNLWFILNLFRSENFQLGNEEKWLWRVENCVFSRNIFLFRKNWVPHLHPSTVSNWKFIPHSPTPNYSLVHPSCGAFTPSKVCLELAACVLAKGFSNRRFSLANYSGRVAGGWWKSRWNYGGCTWKDIFSTANRSAHIYIDAGTYTTAVRAFGWRATLKLGQVFTNESFSILRNFPRTKFSLDMAKLYRIVKGACWKKITTIFCDKNTKKCSNSMAYLFCFLRLIQMVIWHYKLTK